MYTMTGATLHLIVLAGVGPQTSDLNPTDLFLIFLITQFFTINLLKQWLTIVAHLIYIYMIKVKAKKKFPIKKIIR